MRGALLREFCARVDQRRGQAYLETDEIENVPFYQRFGFQTVAEASVIGVPNWFMLRRADPSGRSVSARPKG